METANDTGILNDFLRQVSLIPLLSPEEKARLPSRIRAGDCDAFVRYVEGNLRLVTFVAKRYAGLRPMADIIQDGCIGLMTAVNKFEPDRGYQFSTYAVPWIRQKIERGYENTGRLIRLPSGLCARLQKFEKACNELELLKGCAPSVADIASYTGLDTMKAEVSLGLLAPVSSLDVSASEDGTLKVLDLVTSGDPCPEECCIFSLMQDDVHSLMDGLSAFERDVIAHRFEMDADFETLRQIGQRYSMTREGIRKAEKRALKKMRREALERNMDEYLK